MGGGGQEKVFDVIFTTAARFDPSAASRLAASFAELPLDASVLVDFRESWDVSDLALGVLAAALAPPARLRVALRGLSHHQARLLRYLGVDASMLEAPASVPEDSSEEP